MAEQDELLHGLIEQPSLLLFGSLALSFDALAFDKLRKDVTEQDGNSWALDAISELPQHCGRALSSLAALPPSATRAEEQLIELKESLMTGCPLETAYPLPNTVLIPLVVIYQLIQYETFLCRLSVEHDDRVDPWTTSRRRTETIGLCTGLLSSFVASSAHNREEFHRLGATAVRLGMLAGLATDAQDAMSGKGRYKSLTAAWSSPEAHEKMLQIVDNSQAYISVYYDENRATITTTSPDVRTTIQKLRAAGLAAAELDLYGSFHSTSNSVLLGQIITFCESDAAFRLPDASQLAIPARADSGPGAKLRHGPLHVHALRSILVEPPSWKESLLSALQDRDETHIYSFGSERSIPASLTGKNNARVIHIADETNTWAAKPERRSERPSLDTDIAVVGMSCKVAGANNLEEFWDILMAGESQHREIGKPGSSRFNFEGTPFRSVEDANMKRKWYANLIDGHDQFDHRFFKKSARESATMDPQQRQILQVAYQAVAQSGYLREPESDRDKKMGCFIGVCLSDYENNVACHAANAFTATGNLQGFIAGKVSHFFGWTGPGLTIDSACSSSLVAVHQACQSILSGECSGAVAGGSHIMTSAEWFQNLAAGSFLSPTGQCKPFDAKGDGYCRGEGVGAVFLKKLSRAVADGDEILGVIAASAVQQNENCTPIFVPNQPSLADLFSTVMAKARVKPSQISVVEAHGTGTAVGDPAEYGSIRQVLGGKNRSSDKPLMVSSVKGLVGHMECTSGIISLIKVLLMIAHRKLPPQASFDTISPALGASASDNIFVPTHSQEWNVDFRMALINNYGASGSNASVIITQAPSRATAKKEPIGESVTEVKHPFWLSSLDDKSMRRNIKALRKYLSRQAVPVSLANLSFSLARQSNRSLDRSLLFTARSIDELEKNLAAFDNGDASLTSANPQAPTTQPSVVLCFGGQISTRVGLDRQLYDNVALLRKHLNDVDFVVQSLGYPSIFPGIFQQHPIADTVQLQLTLFAMQYSCARSWIDSGVQPAALIGHSFGELTALCISQILSLEDTARLVFNRATLVRGAWGQDKGAMMAVEADHKDVQKLVNDANRTQTDSPAVIACYNGPRSFVIAGSTKSIDAVGSHIEALASTSIKSKRLNVTNAFHSALVDPLSNGLEESARAFTFREPTIPLELATETHSSTRLSSVYVADHMRNPVYFHRALERVSERLASSPIIFLEAGSNSTITSMAAHALPGPPPKSSQTFQALNITNCEGAWSKLTDATLALWKAGLNVQHWAHHGSQRRLKDDIKHLMLPPYQFDAESKHWFDLKAMPKFLPALHSGDVTKSSREEQPDGLLTFAGYQDDTARKVGRFRINAQTKEYTDLLSGHLTAQTAPICPATVQMGFVIEAICSIQREEMAKREPQIQDVEYQSPVCANSARTTWIEVSETSEGVSAWRFEVYSTENQGLGTFKSQSRLLHTTGKIVFVAADDSSLRRELIRFERLFGHRRAVDLLQSADADEVLSNRSVYRIFSEIVEYGEEFRGLRKLVSRGQETAGHVIRKKPQRKDSISFDPHLADTFCQLGGLWINCLTDRSPNDIYLANGIDQWLRAARRPDEFHVFAKHHRPSDRMSLTDAFIFNASDGSLVEVILGIAYVKVPKQSMEKLLMRLSEPKWVAKSSASPGLAPETASAPPEQTLTSSVQKELSALPAQQGSTVEPNGERTEQHSAHADLVLKVKGVIAELSGLELSEIGDESELADLGIDSLAGMEMVHEIESTFKVALPENEILAVTDMPGLIKCVAGTLGLDWDSSTDSNEHSDIDTPSTTSSEGGISTTNLTTPAGSDFGKDESHLTAPSSAAELSLPSVMEAFSETKRLTDLRVADFQQTHYVSESLPQQDELTAALTIEAFEALGAGFRSAQPGEQLKRIPHGKEHTIFVTYLYKMLEDETQIIKIDGAKITRTTVPLPSTKSDVLYEKMLTRFPDQHPADRLTYYAGKNLARVLSGETDGVKLIFGSPVGRDLVASFYADWPLNRVLYAQMEDFLTRLGGRFRTATGGDSSRPLRVLEMGAGTGGTTKRVVPLLARLGIPVEYTFTDLAPSFVAAARKTWSREYPFMKFRTHDIQNAPEADLVGTQHLVLASNAVHATPSLVKSTGNIRKLLRSDGFLLMLEMTRTPYWVDLTFGLFEGWWLFDDGRRHALTHESLWHRELRAAGYGHVDWTDGQRPEAGIEKLILAAAAGDVGRYSQIPAASIPGSDDIRKAPSPECADREQLVAQYVRNLTIDFAHPLEEASTTTEAPNGPKGILITGATGSLGAHLVASAAQRQDVDRVVCLNRRNREDARKRQEHSLHKKGIKLSPDNMSKIDVFETDLSQPNLGLPLKTYRDLLSSVTHIVHNAWLMHSKWPVKRFEPQLRIMARMLMLARDVSLATGRSVTFEFVSSIATVGHQPLWTSKPVVPETRMSIEGVLPTGYGDAKYICERMLDATLHRFPGRFRAAAVRLGQIAGSSTNGHWNPMEHVSFLVKSSQTLKALPDLPGSMGWTPADVVADTLLDIVTQPHSVTLHPIYHIENPVRQPWRDTIKTIAEILDIETGSRGIIPLEEWVRRVRNWPRPEDNRPEGANPAFLLADFLDDNFVRMSCGGLLMGTAYAREHSTTLAGYGSVTNELIRLYVKNWKDMGFLV